MSARVSVVIPAHDEGAVIARLLSALVEGDPEGRLEIVVGANGCTDDTVARARSVDPSILVAETERASKIAGLNAADALATVLPRIYLDADVTVSAATLLALGDVLAEPGGPLAAAPEFHVDTHGASWPVRAHYAIWELSDYRASGLVGSGIYGLSAEGRARFGAFPEVIADDRFVQQLFTPEERLTLAGHRFSVKAPRRMRSQIKRTVRIAIGNAQLAASGLVPAENGGGGPAALLRRVLRRPALWPAFPFYCYGYLRPRLEARSIIARGGVPAWNRDETTRR
ncbi:MULTISPECIES: glycosyltransferase [unclassified Rathayibacter]|uniref:glycosyltransferase n=1 Tax=unclassified Rathayibacter TaxID=2609250 RepID=UPI00188B98C4|nr:MULTISPECIES: glycosyltransferase [unclassified Rathayibacter]MBF4461275.1 glycosyltransferase [Rathayibacter sp. VKM Ac-2879]MBF4502686.1 glycosyltransferase [Rathayibacter sp. VKM Ac-2878]